MVKQATKINLAVKAIKFGGAALFFAVNGYLAYRFAIAYDDGQRRGQKLHEQRQAKRKLAGTKKEGPKSVVPEELQPQYIEKQVRKYKLMAQQQKMNKV